MLEQLFFGYSKALYSTWAFYKPDHLLLDCGEGAASTLGNGGYGIEKVLLTHGHIDHIAGLPVFLGSRAAGMGDTQKPLQIYYPRGDHFVQDMRDYLSKSHRNLPYPLQWIELDATDRIPLRSNRHLEMFATRHRAGHLTLGYRLIEKRQRLKTEYTDLGKHHIAQLAREGGAAAIAKISETYQANLLSFGGDGLPLPVHDVRNAEILFHEATLLNADERTHQMHSTLDEAVQVAKDAQVQTLVLYHLSGRYRIAEIKKAAIAAQKKWCFKKPLWILHHNRLLNLSDHGNQTKIKK